MADRSPVDISVANPLKHPAVAAWNRLTESGASPKRITRLNKGHSMVYQLAGIAPDGGSVIAKLCSREDAEISRTICTRVLPLVPKPALLFYGCLQVSNHRAWVFLEDAGPAKCCLDNPEHQRAISGWIGALHACLAEHVDNLSLPEAGLSTYLTKLRVGRRKILKGLSCITLDAQDAATLRSVVRWCDRIKSLWDRLDALNSGAPRTLVHGDFAPKNVLLRPVAGCLEVFPIDWETAGWGPPAADLGEGLDLKAYVSEACKYGASWDVAMVCRWAAVGKILRHIAAIEWASTTLVGGWPPRAARRLRARLTDATRAAALEF